MVGLIKEVDGGKKIVLTWIGAGFGEELLIVIGYIMNHEADILERLSIYTNDIDDGPLDVFRNKFKKLSENYPNPINHNLIQIVTEDATSMNCPTKSEEYNISYMALVSGPLTNLQVLNNLYENSDSFIFFQEDWEKVYKKVLKDEYIKQDPAIVMRCSLSGAKGSKCKSFRNLKNLRVNIFYY